MKTLDKNLIKSRFEKSLATYNENAKVQKLMAIKTFELIDEVVCNKTVSILEIGCGTGFLTKFLDRNIKLKKFYANDIVEKSKEFINEINPDINFISGDVEKINIDEKFDLIVSNAVFQWVEDKEKLFEKLYDMLNKNGIIVFSAFGSDNFKEITSITSFSLEYEDYKKHYQNYFCTEFFNQSIQEMTFENPMAILKHIKKTGTNALNESSWTKSNFKEFEEKYKKFQTPEGLKLTYNPVYYVLKKK